MEVEDAVDAREIDVRNEETRKISTRAALRRNSVRGVAGRARR